MSSNSKEISIILSAYMLGLTNIESIRSTFKFFPFLAIDGPKRSRDLAHKALDCKIIQISKNTNTAIYRLIQMNKLLIVSAQYGSPRLETLAGIYNCTNPNTIILSQHTYDHDSSTMLSRLVLLDVSRQHSDLFLLDTYKTKSLSNTFQYHYDHYFDEIINRLPNHRVATNHALLMALVDELAGITHLDEKHVRLAKAYISNSADHLFGLINRSQP